MSPEDDKDERMQVTADLVNNMHSDILKRVVHFMEMMDYVRLKRSMVLACVIGTLMLCCVEVWRTWFPDEDKEDTKRHLLGLLRNAIDKYERDRPNVNDGA